MVRHMMAIFLCAAALGVTVAAQAGELEEALSGAMSAHGSFDEATLCANVPVACNVEQNRIMLSYWQQGGGIFGKSFSTIRYKPYDQCRDWILTSTIDTYCGAFGGEAVMAGSAHGEAILRAEMWDGAACRRVVKTFPLEGTWMARLEGREATGVLKVDMAGDVGSIAFSLDIMPTFERMRGQDECPADDPACEPVRLFDQGVFGPYDGGQYAAACGSRG